MKIFMKLLWVVMLGIVAGVTCLEAGLAIPEPKKALPQGRVAR